MTDGYVWSASEINSANALRMSRYGEVFGSTKYTQMGVAPVLEIPAYDGPDMHGKRTSGGIAIGEAPGIPFLFSDRKYGWLVVAPASQRKANIRWGLYGTDTILTNYNKVGFLDDKTGAQNTDVFTSSIYSSINDGQGSVGAPAATYCQNLEFEGCSDFFLPNYNELILLRTHKVLIDSLDETGTANPTLKLSKWGFGSGSARTCGVRPSTVASTRGA